MKTITRTRLAIATIIRKKTLTKVKKSTEKVKAVENSDWEWHYSF